MGLFRQKKTFGKDLQHLLKAHIEKSKISDKNSKNEFNKRSPFERIMNRFVENPEELESNYESRYFKKNNAMGKRSERMKSYSRHSNVPLIPEISFNTTININNLGVQTKNLNINRNLSQNPIKIMKNLKKDDLKENNPITANRRIR